LTSRLKVEKFLVLPFWQFSGVLNMAIAPVGSIVAYAGKSAPKGWLLCDGKPIEAAFKALIALIGPKTPDLQGYFLRGFDPREKPAERVDPDKRTLLSIQTDAVGPHTHQYNRWFHNAAGKSGGDPTDVAADADSPQTSGPNPGAAETRPKNVAVNYIIKATDEG
jgi:hypothetical protein